VSRFFIVILSVAFFIIVMLSVAVVVPYHKSGLDIFDDIFVAKALRA
jgi:hypothetical protein